MAGFDGRCKIHYSDTWGKLSRGEIGLIITGHASVTSQILLPSRSIRPWLFVESHSTRLYKKRNIAYSTFEDVSLPQPSQIMDASLWYIDGEKSADGVRTRMK